MSIITILLQVFDYDPVFLQLTIDPVNQDLHITSGYDHAIKLSPSMNCCLIVLRTHDVCGTTFRRSLNLRFSRDVGSNMILSAFSSDEENVRDIHIFISHRYSHKHRHINVPITFTSTVIHTVTEDKGVSTPPTFISCSSTVKVPISQHVATYSYVTSVTFDSELPQTIHFRKLIICKFYTEGL